VKRVLVTGGAGFIGSHLCERLQKEGWEVTCLDNFDDFYPPVLKRENLKALLSSDRFRLIEGDIRDEPFLERIFKEGEFDLVVHLAARAGVRPSIRQPLLYEEVNVRGTLNLLEACRRHGVRKFIFASSSSVYGKNPKVPFAEDDPLTSIISPYAATKRAGEILCYTYHHLYGLDVFCLRFFTVYGPRQRPEMAIHKFTRLIHEGRAVPVYGDGSSRRDYTYIDDCIDGVMRAIERVRGYEVVNIGEARTVPLMELVRLIERALGKEAFVEHLPPQPGDVPITYADVTKARKLLGYEPHTPIEEGIRRFVQWFLESYSTLKVALG